MAELPKSTGGAPLNYSETRKAMEADFASKGISKEDIRRAGWNVHNVQDPFGPNPWANQEQVKWNEFEQGPVTDVISGVYNELVLGLGQGVANAIPTVMQAGGSKAPIFDDWINNTNEWFEKQKTVYSDSAYKPVKNFSDYFQGGKFWSTLGEGIGFVLALAAPTKGMKGKWNKRMTSFGVGTTMMYSDLYDEAKQNGFSPQDAARIALATSGIVSMTEGAALEWIGKTATNWIPTDFARNALKGSFKEGSKTGPFDFFKNDKLFATQLMKNIGSKEGAEMFKNAALKAPGNIVKGGTIEFGQEFAQTYIEDGLKEMYDTLVTKTDFVDDKRMGSYEQFKEASFGGIIGAIIGGGLGGAAGVSNTLENNREAVIGHVSNAVKNNQMKKVQKLYAHLDKSLQTGKIAQEDYTKMKVQLDEAVEYGKQTKFLNIQGGVANTQLFDLLKTGKVVKSALEATIENPDVDELISQAYMRNAEKAGKITEKLDAEAKYIIDNRKQITGSKVRFDKMLGDFKVLYSDVIQNKVNDEQFESRLAKIGIISKEKEAAEKENEAEAVSSPGFEHMTDEAIGERITEIKETPKYKKLLQTVKTGKSPSVEVDMLEQELLTRKTKRDELQQKFGQQQQPQGNEKAQQIKQDVGPVSAVQTEEKKEVIPDVIPDEEYNEFVDTGNVSEASLDTITNEISGGRQLSPRQQAIREKYADTIETRLKERADQKKVDDFESRYDELAKQNKPDAEIVEDLKSHLRASGYEGKLESEDDLDKAYEKVVDRIKKENKKPVLGPSVEELHEKAGSFEGFGLSGEKSVRHNDSDYSVSTEGIIRNTKSGQFINPESSIGQAVLKEAGITPQEKDDSDTISNEYEEKKAAAKVPAFIDFTKLSRTETDLKVNFDSDPMNQLSGFTNVEYDSRIADNFELFEKLRDHFLKIFPGMKVEVMNGLVDKYGNQVLGQVVGNGITINKDSAFQSTLLHEFAEVYLEVLNSQDPYLVRRGLDFIYGTQYHKQAQVLYSDYSPAVQLKEALVQAIAEKSLETLVTKFEGNQIDKFMVWMKSFWNKVKSYFTSNKGRDIAQVLANDFALRTNPMQTVTPEISLRYSLGQKSALRDLGMNFIGNVVNSAILMAKFKSDKENTNADASEAMRQTIVALYDRYVLELTGKSSGIKVFDGNVLSSLTPQNIQDNSEGENLNEFYIQFRAKYPERYAFIANSVESALSGVVSKEIDHSINEVKATKDISSNVRVVLSSILDYETGSPVSKENVIRTVLSIADKTQGSTQFMKELNRKALKGDFIASRLKFILESIGKDYSTPILRELSSLEQIEFTSVVLTKDESGKPIFLKRIVNKDYNQEETVNSYINKLQVAAKNGKLSEHAARIVKYSKMSESDKIKVTEEVLKDLFGLSNFNFEFFSAITGYGLGSLNRLISDANSHIIGNTDEKTIRKDFGNYLTKISIAESELDVLQSNFVNTMGNRTPSVHLGSFFTNTRKNLNDKQYVTRLKSQPLYKDNLIVRALQKGMIMKVSRHDAVSNVISSTTDEYANQSTIDNKVNGLLRFAHSFLGKGSAQYDQWIGVTADRGYQTFFTAPRITEDQFPALLKESAARDQFVIDSIKNDWKDLSLADMKKFVSVLKEMTVHNITYSEKEIGIVPVANPNQSDKYKKDIDLLIKEVESLGIKELIENQTGVSLDSLVNQYWFNDYLNRKSLEDLYTGPLERHIIKTKLTGKKLKDISEPIKRMGLANAVGVLNEIEKPVRVIYLDTKGISDSFSFNGSHLQSRLRELGGAIDKVGSSVKDGLFQVDHFNNGETVSMKMSTLGLERGPDGTSNNFNDFSSPENKNPISISGIGDAIIALEDHIGNDPYIKVVDTDVTKNEIPAGAQVIGIDEFIQNANSGNFAAILDKSPEMNFTNYRTVFNLHKDISAIPLSEQTVKLGTQFSVIASNNDTKEQLDELETMIVKALDKQLTGLPRLLLSTTNMVKATLLHADETQSTFTQKVLKNIEANNDRVKANQVLQDVIGNRALDTPELQAREVSFQLRGNSESQSIYDRLMNGENISDVAKSYEPFTIEIQTFDHPNIKYMMENTISNQLSKKGIDLKVAGNFLRVVPDFNEDLEFHNPEAGTVSDIAVPWSMFGNTRQQAEDLMKSVPGGLRVIAVRIPTSGNTMIFAARVKYFIDGASNNVIVPKKFIEVSDSDHDADKLFIYRQDLTDAGIINPGLKTDLFNEYYKRVADPRFIKRTLEESVDVQALMSRAAAVKKKMEDLAFDVEKSLRTFEGTSQVANAMKDGLTGVGIFAVAVKSLSVMYQSGVNLKEPVTIDLGFKANPEDKSTVTIDLKDIDINALEDTALYLQAALDNAKEMALSFVGVNKDNIGTIATMLILGMDVESITAITNNAEVRAYLSKINSDASIYSLNEKQKKADLKRETQTSKRKAVLNERTQLVQREDLITLINATKDDKLNQPVQTDLADGFYKSQVQFNKSTLLYQVKTVDGQKVVSNLNQQEMYSNMVREESNVLSSYFMLESIANELSRITPLIQLDAGLPNNGYDNYQLQENIRSFTNPDAFNFFDVSKLNDRVRYQHYMRMNTAQRQIEQQYFLTEHDGVYEAADDLYSDTLDGMSSKKHIKLLMDETIQTMYAQKLLSLSAQQMNKAALDVWYDGFVKKIGAIKNLSSGVSSNVEPGIRKLVMSKVDAGKELTAFDKAILAKINLENSVMEEFAGTIENSNGQSILIADFLKDNIFLKYLEVVKVKDKQKVILRKSYKSLSQEEMQMVSNSYNDLIKLMPSLASEILDYQLLTNGLNDKIGSYAIIFPDHIHTEYLQILSENTRNKDQVVEKNAMAYKINTAIRIPTMFKEVPKDIGEKNGHIFRSGNTLVYIQDGKQFNVQSAGSFITNGVYYKFGGANEYRNLLLSTPVPTADQINEVKKCIPKKNG